MALLELLVLALELVDAVELVDVVDATVVIISSLDAQIHAC